MLATTESETSHKKGSKHTCGGTTVSVRVGAKGEAMTLPKPMASCVGASPWVRTLFTVSKASCEVEGKRQICLSVCASVCLSDWLASPHSS